jgi:Tol biopolymer transport system component
VGGVIYSPDGKALYLLVSDSLYCMKFEDGHWTSPEIPDFLRDYPKSSGFSISPDGNYFLFANKGDIFSCKRDGNSWSLPVKLPDQISSEKFECIASMSVDHSIYYASHRDGTKGQCDIFYSKFKDGQYESPVNVENFNTSGSECGVYVSPKNDFIIFTGFENREGSYGVTDLYVSFPKDGSWATPQNMGPKINTSGAEWPLSLSPDGKYFFFTRYTPSTKKVEIYWVDSRIILQFKDKI